MDVNINEASEEFRNVAESIEENYSEKVKNITYDDGSLSVLTDTKMPSKVVLNSICKTVSENSDSIWGLVISSGPNDENVLIFVKDADNKKGVFQMYSMVFGVASNVVAATRMDSVSDDMTFEDVADLICEISPENPSKEEVKQEMNLASTKGRTSSDESDDNEGFALDL